MRLLSGVMLLALASCMSAAQPGNTAQIHGPVAITGADDTGLF